MDLFFITNKSIGCYYDKKFFQRNTDGSISPEVKIRDNVDKGLKKKAVFNKYSSEKTFKEKEFQMLSDFSGGYDL